MKMQRYYFKDNCRMCGRKNLKKALSLKPTPPGNDFLSKEELGKKEYIYPLDLYFCNECFHYQLGHVVNPKILFQKNYSYVSSTSKHFVKHLSKYSEKMIKMFSLNKGDLVADIGSNDGTCLRFFNDHGMKVLGIEPASEIGNIAKKNGIDTVVDFFSYNLALLLREKYGPAKFITSHNACAHIDNLFDVLKGVEFWLDKDGVFVFEVGYFVDVFKNTWFDTIYHEHVDYHTVAPFIKMFKRIGMQVFKAQQVSPQGGSIRLMAQRIGGNYKVDESVLKLINLEKDLGLNKSETIKKFENKIINVRKKLKDLIHSLKLDSKIIAGFGAPTKATTLMINFGLDNKILEFIVDDNPLKQGLFTPKTHIPVFPSDALYVKKPDYVLILAWNFAEPIIKMHRRYAKEIGKFIIPMPEPKVID